jgi:hypothetical protein
MSRTTRLLAGLALLLGATDARALFHLANLDEIASGFGGDTNAQYVEIRMLGFNQNLVAHSRLTAFSCDGSTHTVLIDNLPANVCNQGNGVRWTMGTAAWAAATGVNPDFLWDPVTDGSLPTPCGTVCWGAPPTSPLPPNPPTWDAGDPSCYVYCVAYGNATPPPLPGSPCLPSATIEPTALPPGDGNANSLMRVGANLALAAATPTNNGPQSCTTSTTTTTTTTTGPSTTTTTLPKSKCSSKEIAAGGKKAGGKAKCHAKAAGKGIAVDAACLTKEETKFSTAFGKATAQGDCVTAATAPSVEAIVDAFVADLADEATGGSTAKSKCASKQIAAGGKKAADKAKCHAKALNKGLAVDAACLTKAEGKFATAFTKALSQGDCLTATTAGAIEAAVDAFIADVRAAIAP